MVLQGHNSRLLRICITRRLLLDKQDKKGKPYQRPDSKHYCIRITLRHKIVAQTIESWEQPGIFFSSGQVGSTTTKWGTLSVSPSFHPLAYKKKGTHLLPLGITRPKKFLGGLNPRKFESRPEQASKQAGESFAWHRDETKVPWTCSF